MTDNTQPEALDLADWLEAVGGGPSAKRCAALLREQHARITALESQLAQRFDAADVATVSAQGFRDGVASVSAGSEPVANNRPSLEEVFRRLSDSAYCNYIEQIGRDACLGWEHKAAHGKFGEAELKGHTRAGEMLGRHKAFAEAANALRGSDAPLTYPSPPEGMAGWRPTPEMRTVVAVAVTMLYDTHPEDVLRVFDLCELEKISIITVPLGSQRVEDIYRSAWDHLTAQPLASEAKEPK